MKRRRGSWEAEVTAGLMAIAAVALVFLGIWFVKGARVVIEAFRLAPAHRGLWLSGLSIPLSLALAALFTDGAGLFLMAALAGSVLLYALAHSIVASSTQQAANPLGLDQVIHNQWIRTEE